MKLTPAVSVLLKRAFAIAVAVQIIGLLFSIALSSIAFAVASVLFIILALSDKREFLRKNGLEWFFLAYLFSVLLMISTAFFPFEAFNNSRRILLIAVAYFIPCAFSDEKKLRLFLVALVAAAGLQSLLDIGMYYLESFDRLGFFQHYMTSAGLKMFIVLLVLPLLFHKGTGSKERFIMISSSAIILFALVLTQTRSSWLGLLAGSLLIGIVAYRSILVGLTVLVVAFVVLAPGNIMERATNMFATKDDVSGSSTIRSNQIRLRMWETGWRMFLDHPIAGVGDGDMGKVYRQYVPEAEQDEGGHLHNSYVHVLASHGAVGFLAMIALFAAIVTMEWKTFRKGGKSFPGVVALGALAAFTGFAVNGMAEYNFGDHEILVMLWTSVGVTVVARNILAQRNPAAT